MPDDALIKWAKRQKAADRKNAARSQERARRMNLLWGPDDITSKSQQAPPQRQTSIRTTPSTTYSHVGSGSSKGNNTGGWTTGVPTQSTHSGTRSTQSVRRTSSARQSSQRPASTGIHTVRKGDTLWGIATSNGMSVKELLRRNPDLAKRKDNAIYAGDKINLTNIPTKESHMTPAKPKSAKPKAPTYSYKRQSGVPLGYGATNKLGADIRNGGGVRIPTGTIGLPGSDARISLDQLMYE